MKAGTWIKVKSNASGSDRRYAGREGKVVDFTEALGLTCVRAQLAPDQFVCVHFAPKTKRERETQITPIALLDSNNLTQMDRA